MILITQRILIFYNDLYNVYNRLANEARNWALLFLAMYILDLIIAFTSNNPIQYSVILLLDGFTASIVVWYFMLQRRAFLRAAEKIESDLRMLEILKAVKSS